MASGKRASMREGPLAALFRKTETEGLPPETARPRRRRRRVPSASRRRRPPVPRSRAPSPCAVRPRRRSACARRSPPTSPTT